MFSGRKGIKNSIKLKVQCSQTAPHFLECPADSCLQGEISLKERQLEEDIRKGKRGPSSRPCFNYASNNEQLKLDRRLDNPWDWEVMSSLSSPSDFIGGLPSAWSH